MVSESISSGAAIAKTDRLHLVSYSVYFVGFTTLLPWNVLISTAFFWDFKFRNVNEPQLKTDLQKMFMSYMSIASNVSNALFIILHALIGHHFSMKWRIMGSQIGIILTLAVITVLAYLDTDHWQQTFMVTTLILITLMNIFNAILQGSFSARIGVFPIEYLGHLISGAGMGGLVPSLLNVAILALKSDAQVSGFVAFLLAELICVLCLITLMLLEKNSFYRHFADLSQQRAGDFSASACGHLAERLTKIWMQSWMYLLIALLSFMITLSAFPGLMALIEPPASKVAADTSDWTGIYFVPVGCFVVYNLGDWVGKHLAVWIQWPRFQKDSLWSGFILLAMTLSRIAWVPLIFFCNLTPHNRTTGVLFESDVAFILFNLMLSISNGYVGNLACMYAPKMVDQALQQQTASLTVACLVIGCGVGSVISNLLVTLL